MAGRLDDERIIDDEGGGAEAGVEIAEGTLFRLLAHRQCTLGAFAKSSSVLERFDGRARRRTAGGGRPAARATFPSTAHSRLSDTDFDWIDDERQRLRSRRCARWPRQPSLRRPQLSARIGSPR
jgi:hypothetical protein